MNFSRREELRIWKIDFSTLIIKWRRAGFFINSRIKSTIFLANENVFKAKTQIDFN